MTKIEDLSSRIIGTIELSQVRVGIDHACYGLAPWIEGNTAGDAYPVVATHGGKLDLWVLLHLIRHMLAALGHDVQASIIKMDGAKGTHTGLNAIKRSQVIYLSLFEKIVNSLHNF